MKSRISQLADLIINGSDDDIKKLSKVMSNPKKCNYLIGWVLDDPSIMRGKPAKAWDQKPPRRKGAGSY